MDRRAVAKANGYVREANRERDNIRSKSNYSEDSIALQDRVLADYREYAPCLRSILAYIADSILVP